VRQDARSETFLESFDLLPGERFEEPELDVWGRDSDRVHECNRRRAETCRASQDGVANGVRELLFSHRERFRREERVPGRLAEELVGVDAVRLGKLRDGVSGEGLDLEPAYPGTGRKRAEDHPQGVSAVDLVVPVAEEDERWDCVDPAAEQRDDVERRLVRPLHVVEDERRRRPRAELVHERRRHRVRRAALLDDVREFAAGNLGDVEERTEWGVG
jgi:hypothetical protein